LPTRHSRQRPFLMLEKNNLEIAEVIADWLDKQVTPAEATVGAKSR